MYYTDTVVPCDICSANKKPVQLWNKSIETRATKRLGRVFTDIKGPLESVTAKGERLVIVFVTENRVSALP